MPKIYKVRAYSVEKWDKTPNIKIIITTYIQIIIWKIKNFRIFKVIILNISILNSKNTQKMMEEKIFIKKRNKIKRVKTKKHNLGDIKTNKKTF